jgi:glycosyltransferase involved in cell wall biosynthesis
VSDIWPQSAIELGVLKNPIAIRLAEMFERHLYRHAAFVTVPVPGMVERLAKRNLPRDKVVLLTNGVDTDFFSPRPPDPKLARELGLDGRKVFLFAGTHGLAQGLDVILDAAKITEDPDILYVLAGEGARKAALVERARNENIANVRFLPNQPRSAMPALLSLAYASLITLKRGDFFRSTLPVKMYESMASAQPIVGAVWGEAAELISSAGCGVLAEPEDAQSVRMAVTQLAADPQRARRMGDLGRDYVIAHYDRKDIAARLEKLLQEAVGKRRR